ncbi:MAG: hypothetical protein LBP72_06635 [Dysgonamonadaceae bacterium]|jgi:hypothetical protein|nr:hypothetical protein [Dysgonamonadaceae bacterium]
MELDLTAPRSWKELSPGQLIYISWLMTSRQLTKEELHTCAFVRFTGIQVLHKKAGYWLCYHRKRYFTLSPEQALFFCRKFAWLTDSIGEVTPLPKLKGVAHHDARLRGLPFIQYISCESYYQAFIHTKDEKYLNCLIASFYLGEEKFDDRLTQERAVRFQKLPFHIRHTVFLWYYGLKSVFQTQFPYLFQKVEYAAEEEPQAPDMRGQINSMVRSLTGGDITKTDAIYQIDTWTALAELNAKALEYKEMENRMKKYKK